MYSDYFTGVHNVRSWRNWQTRTVQVRVVAISWRFESSRPHQLTMKELLNFLYGDLRAFCIFGMPYQMQKKAGAKIVFCSSLFLVPAFL